MTQPPAPQGQPNILMRRFGPLPVLVWLLLLVLIVFAVIVWRKRKAGEGGDSLAASDLETSGAVLSNPNLFTYPQSVYLYRDDDVDTPSSNDDDDTDTPAPKPPAPTPNTSDPFEQQRWFGTKVPYKKATVTKEGVSWLSLYNYHAPLWNPKKVNGYAAEGGPWNLYLYNAGRLKNSTDNSASAGVNSGSTKIPVGTVVAIPTTVKPAGGMGANTSPVRGRSRTMATQRAVSDMALQGPGPYKTSSTMGRAIPQ